MVHSTYNVDSLYGLPTPAFSDECKASMERLRQRLSRKTSEKNELEHELQEMQSKVCVCVFMSYTHFRIIQYLLQSSKYLQRIDQLEGLLRERNISIDDLPPISIMVPVPPPASPMPPLPPPLPTAPSTQQPHMAPGLLMS